MFPHSPGTCPLRKGILAFCLIAGAHLLPAETATSIISKDSGSGAQYGLESLPGGPSP